MEDIEAGFPGCSATTASPPIPRRPTYRSLSHPATTTFFYEDLSDDEPRHFLDSCFLCKRPLSRNLDIFMYRGDTPFCSEVCREEQIEMDEAREKSWKISVKKEKQKNSNSSSSPNSRTIHVRAGAVVAG
ncbi:uncharacterized protein LOC110020793 [Phalaenopsis equestris]|uniref:uncharacterized protein LOC110020793 n=1 Tax=Phalaenopsis equestris TaxID=78828 RepID=UPI0009E3EB32|nr:uncharacterized protein LOC110020793 [Phalaenopsis equestris]